MSVMKNIYLSVEISKDMVPEPEWLAEDLAKVIIDEHDIGVVKSVQYRYGAFGRVEKLHANTVLPSE